MVWARAAFQLSSCLVLFFHRVGRCLKALIRKFGQGALPEMAELIIGFQSSAIQSITTAINHSACNHLSNAP